MEGLRQVKVMDWRMGVKLEKATVQAELGPQQQGWGGGAVLQA